MRPCENATEPEKSDVRRPGEECGAQLARAFEVWAENREASLELRTADVAGNIRFVKDAAQDCPHPKGVTSEGQEPI